MQRRVTREGENLIVTVEFPENKSPVYVCSSDDDASEDSATELVSSLTTSDEDSSLVTTGSGEEYESDTLPDIMTLGELNAAKTRLETFIDKCDRPEQVSLVEQHRIFDASERLQEFSFNARCGRAELFIPDEMSSTRKMAALAFNRSSPAFKTLFLDQLLGNVAYKANAYLLFGYVFGYTDVEKIRNRIVANLQDIGGTIAAKNKERYEAVAKMPAYSTVIKARRAEVEAMLDAGNQQEYLATQRM